MSAYQVLPFEPGSPEWVAARNMVIGSSDASAVLGVSPYGITKRKLWRQKRGLEEGQYEHAGMLLGRDYEVRARYLFEKSAGELYPATFIQSTETPWAVASMDGLNQGLNQGWENKCCEEGGSQHMGFLNEDYAPHDYAQIQHQIGWMGLDCVWYSLLLWRHCPWCRMAPNEIQGCTECNSGRIWNKELFIKAVGPDPAFIARLKAEETAFYALMESGKQPPLADTDDMDTDDPEFAAIASSYREWDAAEKAAAAEKARLRPWLVQTASRMHSRVRGGGVLVTPKGIYIEKLENVA